ncbi:MAG: Na+/H+ antiporter NhaA [Pacificimonas sp.]|jgi:NhaA family Na+:H+ antiporter|nr:Na+/H+ antiporter NhaA [Pacificimonas sp.]
MTQPKSSIRTALQDFLKQETSGGFMLMGAAALAMILVNAGAAGLYNSLWATPVNVSVGSLAIDKPLLLWVNDGLMAIFFFLVGLEVKREVMEGQLSTWNQASLPVFAAIGGMAIPAAVFVGINWGTPENLDGWAIPAATDIAFALGILALLGARAPVALKVLLLAVAIIDDIGAILIIALFYTAELSTTALIGAAVAVAVLFALNRSGVSRTPVYVLVGIVLWVFVLKSGVHATLAGVVAALAIPLNAKDGTSPLKHAEHALHTYVAFLILPVFAFANAGVSLIGVGPDEALAPLPLGIAMGLFFGKQIGVFGFAWLAIKLGAASMPAGVNWRQLYGLACLTGVGFTMSLFIGGLAFDSAEQMNAVKIGVLGGSLLAGLVGYGLLRVTATQPAGMAAKAS